KAGVMKYGTPLIIGHIQDESKDVLLKEIDQLKTPSYFLGEQFSYEEREEHVYTFINEDVKQSFSLKMRGIHQVENASLAFQALLCMKNQFSKLTVATITESINNTVIGGRFETVYYKPNIIID